MIFEATKTRRGQPDKHYHIDSAVSCINLGTYFPIQFCIDLGATKTTLVSEKIGLSDSDYSGLRNGETTNTPKGDMTPKMIKNVIIRFVTVDGKPHVEPLREIDVMNVKEFPIDGLLGIDVIDRFSWVKGKDCMILWK